MFGDLSKYTELIQLLVGSIFLSDFVLKPHKSLDDEFNKIREFLKTQLQGFDTDKYKIETNTDWIKWEDRISSYVVILTVLYGCLVLFYCVNKTLSPLGLFIESMIVSLFIVYSLCLYGKRRTRSQRKAYRFWFYLALLFSVGGIALFFIHPKWNKIQIWFDRDNQIFNAWVIINFVLWFIVYIKCFVLYLRVKWTCMDSYRIPLLGKLNITSRLVYYIEKLENTTSVYDSVFLQTFCMRDLGSEKYYYEQTVKNEGIIIVTFMKDNMDKINEKIDASNISDILKWTLKLIGKITFRNCRPNRNSTDKSKEGNDKKNIFTEVDKIQIQRVNSLLEKLEKIGIVQERDK